MVSSRQVMFRRGRVGFRPRLQIRRRRVGRRMPMLRRRVVGRRGVKRRASMRGPVGTTKRRRVYRDKGSYQQRDTLVSRAGRKTSQYKFMNKLVKASYSFDKMLLRAFGIDGAGGSTPGLLFHDLGFITGGTNVQYLPLYMINLTSVPQAKFDGSGTSNTSPPCIYRLQGTRPGFTWVVADGIDAKGQRITQPGFFPNDATYVSGTGYEATSTYDKVLMEYLNIKYTLRGPTQRGTRIIVQVVQPYKWFKALPGVSGNDPNQNGVWENEASRLCVNMCQSIPSASRAPWKVLYNKVYELQPTLTTESDASGHEVHQRHFWKCNRVLNYRDTLPRTQDAGYAGDLDIGYDVGRTKALSSDPAPGTALWLLIKAYSPDTLASAADPATMPSFDVSVEKKLSFLA